MKYEEYGYVDIDKLQQIDNENYLKNSPPNKETISPNVLKGPKDISQYLENHQPTEWIIDSFGARGACVILAGDKGSGKSSFLYRLAESISKGEKFLSELSTIKKKVLVWQSDESKINALNKLKRMDINKGFDIVFKEEGWDQLNLGQLKEQIKINNYGVVLIDSISTLIANRGINFKDMEIAKPLYELNDLAGELNVLIIINSHLNKEDRDGINLNDLLGSGQISSAVSDIWSIYKPQKPSFDEHYIIKCLGKRNCEDGIYWNLQGNKEDFSWKFVSVGEDDLLPTKKIEYKYKILNLLNENEKGLSLKEIESTLNCSFKTVQRCTTLLFDQNKIWRKKRSSGGGRAYYLYFGIHLGHEADGIKR